MLTADSTNDATGAFGVATPTDSADTLREHMILVRKTGNWTVTAHPDMHFKIIAPK